MDGRILTVIIVSCTTCVLLAGMYIGVDSCESDTQKTIDTLRWNLTVPYDHTADSDTKYISNELAESVGIPEFYLNASEVYNLAEKDEYNQPMFWVQNYNEKIVWILLPNSSGHLRAYVEDIGNLSTTYRIIDEFNSNETWK